MTGKNFLNEGGENPDAKTCVERVRLNRFRNYEALDIGLANGFNVLAGRNAQGKTNFLESLYLLSTGRLLRGQRDLEAIMEGSTEARVEAHMATPHSTLGMHLQQGVRKRALLNGQNLPRASDVLGRLPSVCISSEDLSLARGEPADRRLFLDIELSSLYATYLRDLGGYKRALEHRNALVRHASDSFVPAEEFEPWEIELATYGSRLRSARAEYVSKLTVQSSTCHAEIASGEILEARYSARDEAVEAEDLLALLNARRGEDVRRGGTSVGPHRDEVSLSVEGRDVRLYGSQGQQRSSTIAVKLGSLIVAREERRLTPLLLLDDVFSDLDEARRTALIDLVLRLAGQVVLTCTEVSAAGPRILEQAECFSVAGGAMTRDDRSH